MLKKFVIAGAAMALLSGVVYTTGMGSYVRCAARQMTEAAGGAVSPEFELERARMMIEDLDEEIGPNARRIAREKIEVAKLERQISKSDTELAKAENDIQRLAGDLKRGNARYTYAGVTYTSAQVKSDLTSRFDRFKMRRETAERLHEMMTARRASLVSAQERMEAMLTAKQQLKVEVENLQARLGALRVAQTTSDIAFDDSALSQTRDLLDDIAARIEVEEEVLNVDTQQFSEIQLEDPVETKDLLDEISMFLDPQTGADDIDAEISGPTEQIASIQLD